MGITHLIKLCVGAESVEDLSRWQVANRPHWPGGKPRHVTRMWPKREAELLGGGSLYWVIKGLVLCRQSVTGLEAVTGSDGISRCALILDPEIIATETLTRRAFQGWRYLSPEDAPRDLPAGRAASRAEDDVLPPELARALAEIGLR